MVRTGGSAWVSENIVALHQAQAEYYFLMGRYKDAISQLELAQTKNQGAYPASQSSSKDCRSSTSNAKQIILISVKLNMRSKGRKALMRETPRQRFPHLHSVITKHC